MATDSKILREYLLALGFKVDEASNKKFDWTLGKLDLRVAGLGAGVWKVIKGTNEMVTQFARGMERMYYSSIKAQSSAGNLAAIGYGAKQIGLTSDGMVASIEGVARALRLNPGLHGLVESFGVQVKGRDMSVVAQDLVKALAKMPHYIGSQYAGLFGISSDDLLLWGKNADKLDKLMAEHKKMAADAGVDLDKATESGLAYANALDRIAARFDILKKALSIGLLPIFNDMADAMERGLASFTSWLTRVGLKSQVKLGDENAGKSVMSQYMDFTKKFWSGGLGSTPGARKATGLVTSENVAAAAVAMGSAVKSIDATLAELLPKVLKQESGGRRYGKDGKILTSLAGAKGEMQVMDGTMISPGYGVMGARDGSPEERARVGRDYLRAMLVKYGGDAQLALAAYNGGPAHLDGVLASGGKRNMLPETYDYVRKITGQALTLNTTVNVNGAGDPKATGAVVAKAVNDTNSALLRNLMTVNY